MNTRWVAMVLGGLFGAVIIAGLYFPILKQRVKQTAKIQPQSEEQARRELTQSLTANPTEARVNAKLFWASNAHDGSLTPVTVELPLSERAGVACQASVEYFVGWPRRPRITHTAARRGVIGVLPLARRNRHRGFFRSDGELHSIRDRKRTTSGGFHDAHTGGQCFPDHSAQNFNSRAGSGNAGGPFGSYRFICGEPASGTSCNRS